MIAKEISEFDALMKLAEFNITQFNERRKYTWQVTIGFWGAIIGSIAVIIPYRDHFDLYQKIIIGISVVVIHALWVNGFISADRRDKSLAFKCRDEAIKIIKNHGIVPPEYDVEKSIFQDWTFQFTVISTSLLVIIAIIVLSLP